MIEQLHLLRFVAGMSKFIDPKAQFPALFTGLGKLKQPYTIWLKEGALSTPQRVAIPLLPAVQEELQHMELIGVIKRGWRAHRMVCGHGCGP